MIFHAMPASRGITRTNMEYLRLGLALEVDFPQVLPQRAQVGLECALPIQPITICQNEHHQQQQTPDQKSKETLNTTSTPLCGRYKTTPIAEGSATQAGP
jgi:hypothetical protein